MRRSRLLALSIVVLITTALGGGAPATAQDATSGHPLVGAWTLDTDTENPDNPMALGYFAADGGYIEIDVDGIGLGAWTPTGDTTADATFSYVDPEGGVVTVRASIEVAPDGQAFTASYTLEFFDPATGEWSGEIGPGSATGTRMAVEAPGSAGLSLEEALAQASPEATPAP